MLVYNAHASIGIRSECTRNTHVYCQQRSEGGLTQTWSHFFPTKIRYFRVSVLLLYCCVLFCISTHRDIKITVAEQVHALILGHGRAWAQCMCNSPRILTFKSATMLELQMHVFIIGHGPNAFSLTISSHLLISGTLDAWAYAQPLVLYKYNITTIP